MIDIFPTSEIPTDDKCAQCLSGNIKETSLVETIIFGDQKVEIPVEVVAIECEDCGFLYTDSRAECVRHDAICRHQNLLTPGEIRQIRTKLEMSRREFSDAFGIPPASMERWENGKLFQNRSTDTLLRGLLIPNMATALDRRKLTPAPDSNVVHIDFLALASEPKALENARARSSQFILRRANS